MEENKRKECSKKCVVLLSRNAQRNQREEALGGRPERGHVTEPTELLPQHGPLGEEACKEVLFEAVLPS